MRKSLIAVAVTASALVLGTLALAQPRGTRPARAPGSGAPAGSASTAAASIPPGDAGPAAPSPAPSEVAPAGGALSPLNPAPNEFSDAAAPPASIDYDRLLADIASLRARAAAVGDILFRSRLMISFETSGDHARIASLSVALDDGAVWTSPAAFRAEDAVSVYDHAVAPGHHAVTVDVERRDDRDETFRSSQRSRFIVDVPADGRLSLAIKLLDESNMGSDFPSDRKGTYDLRIRALAKAQSLPPQGK
jgi:hypothetical protein